MSTLNQLAVAAWNTAMGMTPRHIQALWKRVRQSVSDVCNGHRLREQDTLLLRLFPSLQLL